MPRIKCPGFGLPIDYEKSEERQSKVFRSFFEESSECFTVRERSMMKFMDRITDKNDWRSKVFKPEIIEKWRREAANTMEDWSDKAFEESINELQHNAGEYVDSDMIPIYHSAAAIYKSDTIISAELKQRIRNAVRTLEDVPSHKKDWHPGSDGKVLDLVHPSLYPLIYGKSRVLPERQITMDDCLQAIGEGEVLPSQNQDPQSPSEREPYYGYGNRGDIPPSAWSSHYQWLPCEVERYEDGRVRIVSYINNLHPRHTELYNVIELLIERSIPLWSETLSKAHVGWRDLRIDVEHTEYDFAEGYDSEDSENREEGRTLIRPDPRPFKPPESLSPLEEDNRRDIGYDLYPRLQVIVKLANIHLTSENPKYPGGSWHIEGQLNEHIVATSLYYYDSNNITPSYLSFRSTFNLDGLWLAAYGQDDYSGVEDLFGISNYGQRVQSLGSTLTREGRLLAFPNTIQHCVEPFELVDKSLPGHRKIVALFLVDPTMPILSTANVPPQQKSWWIDEIRASRFHSRIGNLPTELQDIVFDDVDFPIGEEEAKEVRTKLMKERGMADDDVERNLPTDINFCEH